MAFDESLLEELDGFDESLLQPIEEPTPATVPRSMEWEGPPIPPPATTVPSPAATAEPKPVSKPIPTPWENALGWAKYLGGQTLRTITQPVTTLQEATVSAGEQLGLLTPDDASGARFYIHEAPQGPQIPQIPKQESAVPQAAAGVANAAIDFGNFLLTPDGAATLGISGLPSAAKKMIVGTFSAQMAAQAPEQIMAANESFKRGDVQGGVKEAVSGIGGIALSAALAREATKPNVPKPSGIKPSIEEEVKQTSPEVETAVPEKVAEEIGFTFNPEKQAGALSLEGLPPELKEQVKPQWEFTDRRAGSPTEGITFYVPEGASREQIIDSLRKKQADVAKAETPAETAPEPKPPNEQESNAQRVVDMSSDEFKTFSDSMGDRTKAAEELGMNVSSQPMVDWIKQQWEDFSAQSKSERAKGNSSAAALAQRKSQYFREAYETATGTGMASVEGGIFSERHPNYKPPFPITETEKGPAYAAKEGQVEEGVQPERERTDAQRVPAEAGVGNRLQPAAQVQAGQEGRPAPQEVLLSRVAAGIPDPIATAKAATKIVTDFISSAKPELKTMAASLQGKAVPRTSTAAPESGNALVRYASARIAAPAVARSMATDVLGPNYKDAAFSQKLGAVLVEDRLRAIKTGLQQAGDPDASLVQSIIGKPWSPFKTEADYKAALNDVDIANAIERHKATVQQRAEEAHVMARGELAGMGQDTGAFVNLKAVFPEAEVERFGQGGRGNLENPLRRLSRFFREAKGTGEKYELDYRKLAERMIQGNFEEAAKRQLYDQYIKDGLAVETDPGVKAPEIGGKPTVGFTIERRGVPAGENQARTFIKKLWVRQDLAREFRQAEDLDGPVAKAGLVTAANIINRIQLAGPTDAVWHTANMIGSIAGSQGGKTLLSDFARKLPGVNLADALARTTTSAIRVMRDDPNIQRQIAELAELGAMRAPHDANFMGRFIQFIDRAGRLVRDDMYQNLVRRGVVTASEAGRRDWVNQMGAYNPRLMGQFQRFFKEAGFSPFIVAGRNFNRMAMRRLFMQPGIEAANPKEALKLRAVEAFGTLATLVVVPSLINYALTGNPSGRPGTKFGAIDTGKNDKDGNAIVIDPAQWTGLRRGLRISGGQAVIEGMRRGQSGKQIARSVLRDQLGGIMHPWTGPPVTAATVAATGYDPRSYKQSEDPSDPAQNLKAALEQLNPVVKAIITSHEKDTPIAPTSVKEAATAAGKAVGEIGKSFGGAVGVKAQKLATPKDQLTDLHQVWMRNNPDKKIRADYERRQKEQFVSDYKDLDTAMTKNDGPAVLRAINKLLESKTPKDLNERMSPFYKESPAHIEGTKKPLFQESLVTEGKFYRTLTDAQKKIYQQAQKDRVERYKRFVEYLKEAIRQRQAPAPRGPIPQPYA